MFPKLDLNLTPYNFVNYPNSINFVTNKRLKDIVIIFAGQSGQIDANTLAVALGHYNHIMESADNERGGVKFY